MQTRGQTDVMKLIVACHNFVNMPLKLRVHGVQKIFFLCDVKLLGISDTYTCQFVYFFGCHIFHSVFQTLRLSMTALRETTVGQAVNLMSNDVNRFDASANFLVYLWFGPLETLVISYLMWREIGFAAFVGVGAIMLVIPLQGVFAENHINLEVVCI
jgi:ABC transporter transmembrane region.